MFQTRTRPRNATRALAAAAGTAIAATALALAPISATAASPYLLPGETLTGTAKITSANGQFSLAAQGAGPGMIINSLSCSPTYPGPSVPYTATSNRLVMQGDGNLVQITDGKATWSSGTQGNPGAKAMLRNDGRIGVYAASGAGLYLGEGSCSEMFAPDEGEDSHGDSQLRANWFLSSPDGTSKLTMQGDGNLVLQRNGKVQWHSRTYGNPGARAVTQSDGNFVIYSANGKALWSSGTSLKVAYRTKSMLRVQNDGNVVFYRITDPLRAAWATGTHR